MNIILLIIICLWPCAAQAWPATVIEVIDGDTITVAPAGQKDALMRIRLYGIDAPELAQPYGDHSAAILRRLLARTKRVQIIPMRTDRYGRTVALVVQREGTVNKAMLEQGAAWFYEQYCTAHFCQEWKEKAALAAQKRMGLWEAEGAIDLTPPWQWRHQNGVGAARLGKTKTAPLQ